MRPSGAVRVRVVVAVYVVAVAVALAGRMAGDETAQLGTVLLAAAGLGAVLQLNRPRARAAVVGRAPHRRGAHRAWAYVASEVLPRDRASGWSSARRSAPSSVCSPPRCCTGCATSCASCGPDPRS